MGNNSTKSYLKIPKVQQPRELERPPTSKLNPRAEKIQGEGGSHGTEKLRQYKKRSKDSQNYDWHSQLFLETYAWGREPQSLLRL